MHGRNRNEIRMCQDGREPLPFSDWCFLCGDGNPRGLRGRFYRSGQQAYLLVTPVKEFNGYQGVLHGGIAAGLLDETMGWAAALAINRMCLTAEITIRYLEQVPVETTLEVMAEPVKATNRLCVVRGELRVAQPSSAERSIRTDRLLARATGKFMPLSLEETVAIDNKLIYEPDIPRVFKFDNDLP